MNNFEANKLLDIIHHRPTWQVPGERWVWYQEWNRALFFHWKVDPEILKSFIPEAIQLDVYNNTAWVSLVAFTMEKIRPRYLPSVSLISDFHEINLRTYVTDGEHHGVYFLSIEAQKQLSAILSRRLSGLPYEKASIQRKSGYLSAYDADNSQTGNYLKVDYRMEEQPKTKTELDRWLTERYYLYLEKGNRLYRYAIHHKEWNLFKLKTANLHLSYNIGALSLSAENIEMVHYSDGVNVIAWQQEMINR